MKVGFVVNNVDTELAQYSTTRLAMAASTREHEVWLMGVGDLSQNPVSPPWGTRVISSAWIIVPPPRRAPGGDVRLIGPTPVLS